MGRRTTGWSAADSSRHVRLWLLLLALIPLIGLAGPAPPAAHASPSGQSVARPSSQALIAEPASPAGRWTLLNPPPARSQHTAIWDAPGDRMLVFGGGGRSGDVWSYQASSGRWTQLAARAPARIGLPGQSVTWDPVRAQFLLYGGLGQGEGGDLWSYRPDSSTWVDLSPGGARPAGRAFHSAVWDPTRDQMLVFAGLGSGFDPLNDLWAYRPATNAWFELTPPRPRPLPVFYHIAVWSPAGQQMLVFGGADPLSGRLVDELWSFGAESGTWTRLQAVGQPPVRLWHTGVCDELGARLLLFVCVFGAGGIRGYLLSF